MRYDVQGPDRSAFDRAFDVCVIGTGPAGTTLARSLADAGMSVALMEGGELEWSEESQNLYAGEITGHEYPDPDWIRLRQFGGTSGHWNGACRYHEQAIFEPRAQNPLAGWPIGKADLDPYEEATHRILDLAPADGPMADPWAPGDRMRRIRFWRSPPTRFAEKYLDEVSAHPRIFLGYHANLVDLRLGGRASTRSARRASAPTRRAMPVSRSGRGSIASAPAVSRMRACCSISAARSPKASATPTARSGCSSATTPRSNSAR